MLLSKPVLCPFVEKTESYGCVVTSKLSTGFHQSVCQNTCKYFLIAVILGYFLKIDHKLFSLCSFCPRLISIFVMYFVVIIVVFADSRMFSFPSSMKIPLVFW